MKKHKALSWKPRLRIDTVKGIETYCAPACGRGCTFQEYIEAKNAAAKLMKRLGPGWTPHVYENLGWHYDVRRGPLTLHVHWYGKGRPNYSCMLASEPTERGCGSVLWHDRTTYRTPEAAVNAQLQLARRVLKRLMATFLAAEGGVWQKKTRRSLSTATNSQSTAEEHGSSTPTARSGRTRTSIATSRRGVRNGQQ